MQSELQSEHKCPKAERTRHPGFRSGSAGDRTLALDLRGHRFESSTRGNGNTQSLDETVVKDQIKWCSLFLPLQEKRKEDETGGGVGGRI